MMYRVKVRNKSGDFIGEFSEIVNLKFSKRLNNYGSCQIVIPLGSEKISSLISLRQNEVWIYKEDTLVWAGEMATSQGKLDKDGGGTVTLYCFTWFEQLRSRFTSSEVIYSSIEQGQIAWNLIDTTQSQTNGDFGITLGTFGTSKERDRTYNNQNIQEAIINLSEVIDGFDFEITDEKVFNTYSLLGNDLTDSVVLEYGQNITNASIITDFTEPVNRAIELGEATGEDDLSRVDVNDTSSQGIYLIREAAESQMSISDLETLTSKGQSLLQKKGLPLLTIGIELIAGKPDVRDISSGDYVRLIVNRDPYSVDETHRIYEWQLEYDSDNNERLVLITSNYSI